MVPESSAGSLPYYFLCCGAREKSVCRFLAVPTTAHLGAPNFDLKALRTKQEFKNVIDADPLNSAEVKLLLRGRV
jgi:hypothetical protein